MILWVLVRKAGIGGGIGFYLEFFKECVYIQAHVHFHGECQVVGVSGAKYSSGPPRAH